IQAIAALKDDTDAEANYARELSHTYWRRGRILSIFIAVLSGINLLESSGAVGGAVLYGALVWDSGVAALDYVFNPFLITILLAIFTTVGAVLNWTTNGS